MLKGVVDVAPIAMLKVAQDQAGSFDFLITTQVKDRVTDGDYNFYGSDPFKYPEVLEQNQTNNILNQT